MSKSKQRFRVVSPSGEAREWTFDESGVVSDRRVESRLKNGGSDGSVQVDCSMRNGHDSSENIVFDSGKKVGGFFGHPVVIILLILLVIGLIASLWLLNKRRIEDTEFLGGVIQEERGKERKRAELEKARVAALHRAAEEERIKLKVSQSEAVRLREVIEEPKRRARTKKAKVAVDSVSYSNRGLAYRLCEKSGVGVMFDRYRLIIEKPYYVSRDGAEKTAIVFDSDIMPLESSLTIEKGQCCPKLKYRSKKVYLLMGSEMVLNRKIFSLQLYHKWLESGGRIVLMLLGEDENGHSVQVTLQL